MAQITKRVDADLRQLSDLYNTHWAGDGWACYTSYGQLGNTTEFEVFGEWYGGIKNLSMRFTGINIPAGATITSATITLTDNTTGHNSVMHFKITGVDEDNTGEYDNSPIDDARTRTHTTAVVDWDLDFTSSDGTARASSDISSIIQEIIDRAGWSSGNAIGIYLYDDGTSNNYWDIKYYSNYPNYVALLTIDYLTGSPSPSPSPSSSISPSVSISLSPSVSKSLSPSVSISQSPSPSPRPGAFFGLKIAKDGYNVLDTDEPERLKFSSDYGTLKYFTKQSINISFNAAAPDSDISARGEYSHNLNYYPYAEVYVRTYTGATPTGNYEYCPFFGSGATVAYSANYILTKTKIYVYGQINGVSSSVWHFDFIVFLFKNSLSL